MLPKLTLLFRKPGSTFNSIETVFNALIPHFEKEFKVEKFYLAHRTHGVFKMRKNYNSFRNKKVEGLVHVTGHDNYMTLAAGEKAVLTLHDINSAFSGSSFRDSFIRKYWLELPLKRAKKVTVISEFSAREIEKMLPQAKGKLTVIPNPVDDRIIFQEKRFHKNRPRILFVGTKENKNLEKSILAISEMKCTAVIIGKLTRYQTELLKYATIDYENFQGLSFEEVISEYYKCDLLCFPSTYEGFGMPILEAQAMGRAVITSNFGAMRDTAGEGAHLLDPNNVKAIRDGIQRIIDENDYRNSLIEEGLENVKQYRAEKIAVKYLNLYKEVLNEG